MNAIIHSMLINQIVKVSDVDINSFDKSNKIKLNLKPARLLPKLDLPLCYKQKMAEVFH